MLKKFSKFCVLALATGTLFQFGGLSCITRQLPTVLTYAALEFATDGGLFDLFPDGPAAATTGG